MGAAAVRKRISTLGCWHLATPLCCPKLVRVVAVLLLRESGIVAIILLLYCFVLYILVLFDNDKE